MLDFKDPKRVVVEGEVGHYFDMLPQQKDLDAMNRYDSIYTATPIIAFFSLLFLFPLLVVLVLEEGILASIEIICITTLFLELIILIVAIMIRFERYKERKKKKKGTSGPDEMKIYHYIKVFPSVTFLYLEALFINRLNIIRTSEIKAVHFDVPDFLMKNGIRIPMSYRPFRQSSPSPLKYKGSLHLNHDPMDHLVRIEFKRPVEIKAWDPKQSRWALKMNDDTLRSVNNIIISIRPRDQDRFKRAMDAMVR